MECTKSNEVLIFPPEASLAKASAVKLSHIFGAEHPFGSSQDGVLAWIVGMILGRNFQDSGDRCIMLVDGVTNQLCNLHKDNK